MYAQRKAGSQEMKPVLSIIKPVYTINDHYLRSLGFKKNEVLSGLYEWVYKYYDPVTGGSGLELFFSKEFGILSIEEFWFNHADGGEYIAHTIVGKFKICSDDDLHFIFSRNIRLNHIFNVAGKRV